MVPQSDTGAKLENLKSFKVSNTYLESPQCCQIHHFVDVYPKKQLMLIVITPNFFCQVSYESSIGNLCKFASMENYYQEMEMV